MATNAPSTVRARHFRERRSRGVAMVAPVEVGEGAGQNAGLLPSRESLMPSTAGQLFVDQGTFPNQSRRLPKSMVILIRRFS